MSYPSVVLADNPQHYWRAADPGGFLLHDIGGASPITMESAFDNICMPYSGPASDGGSCAIPTFGGPSVARAITITSPMSLEAWAYWIGPLNAVFIAAFDGVSVNTFGLSTGVTGDLACSCNGSNLISGTVLTFERWHHCVQTYDGVNQRLYLDALLVGTQAVAGPVTGTHFLRFGSAINGSSQMFGAVAEMAQYNVALSPAQITAHFLAADTANGSPVFKGASSTSSTPPFSIVDLTDVLNAVRKTY